MASDIHYMVMCINGEHVISCGAKGEGVEVSDCLEDVTCETCMEIEMDVCVQAEESRIERGQNNWSEGRKR